MLNEEDKNILDTIEPLVIEQLVLKVEEFIIEANQLLETYPQVDFDNAFSTAYFQSENIANSVKEYSDKVWNNLLMIFGEYQPSAQRQFGMARLLVPQAYSEYGIYRNTLLKKLDILVDFRNDLNEYINSQKL